MTVEKILEKSFEPPTYPSKEAKLDLLVHCSCGEDYEVENVVEIQAKDMHYRIPTECPSCKDVSYLTHKIVDGRFIGIPHIYTVEIGEKETRTLITAEEPKEVKDKKEVIVLDPKEYSTEGEPEQLSLF